MHPFLSSDAVDDLRCLAAMIIPASQRFGIPAADDPAVFADLLGSLGHDRIEVEAGLAHVRAKAGGPLPRLDAAARARVLGAIELLRTQPAGDAGLLPGRPGGALAGAGAAGAVSEGARGGGGGLVPA